jgi:glyoxylase-like metal-dependent hydrolase (beta-lactamase superfamily II)
VKKAFPLWSSDRRRWLVIARDPERAGHLIDTNEYVMDDGATALVTDPGGLEIFPAVFSAVAAELDPSRIDHIFASHQDPDVISSLSLWLAFKPTVTCHLSWLWQSFVPHFGGLASTFAPIPDEGAELRVGQTRLHALPAHYLHSSGNFHLHDPEARLLFSGDVGAAMPTSIGTSRTPRASIGAGWARTKPGSTGASGPPACSSTSCARSTARSIAGETSSASSTGSRSSASACSARRADPASRNGESP